MVNLVSTWSFSESTMRTAILLLSFLAKKKQVKCARKLELLQFKHKPVLLVKTNKYVILDSQYGYY